ncbi:probable UBC6 - E2 ubiquitin-conjugating enzyme [Ustilago trichophora]|uniref:Probable UBC6 - E2 ubiquitin-conjugating enzyme n=1 Tax=Ustilago trichophora TaxID=86804 RepID=A0A5C3EBA2_9BASI|nr:probable UBC6 - E2 ubiquitin-conjugating enzyme [Ustilago trichophora]
MATTTSHNKKSSAIKRILSEARELASDSSHLYTAAPLEDNIFEWHFTLRGPANTEFANGLYHGRILLPPEYPMRPPSLMLLTPNGRWELNKKICLTFTGFHEEMWQPAWGIRTALLGLQTFMTAKAEAAVGIGALDFPVQARQKLARESRTWTCGVCDKTTLEMLPDPDPDADKKVEEGLPDGLQVDLTAQSHKPQQDSSSSNSYKAAHHSSTAPNATIPVVQTQQATPTPLLAPVPLSPTPPAAAAPVAVPQPQLQHRLASTVPHRTTSASPPTTPAASLTPIVNQVSATEQKLTLIDNCIKALGILVFLLVVKRLI